MKIDAFVYMLTNSDFNISGKESVPYSWRQIGWGRTEQARVLRNCKNPDLWISFDESWIDDKVWGFCLQNCTSKMAYFYTDPHTHELFLCINPWFYANEESFWQEVPKDVLNYSPSWVKLPLIVTFQGLFH